MNAPNSELLSRLRSIVGERGIVETADAQAPYLRDHRHFYQGRAALILRPGSVAEISQILAACNNHRVGVVPHGGNTSYCGGATPDESGEQILLTLARLNRIRSVEPLNNAMTVEAGCVLRNVQEAALNADRYFPLSLGAEGSCQIGGNLSTNAGGTAVMRYGMARELVLGLEVVLPDGRVLEDLGSLRKDNTGYDLKSLFIGAEGTLGVITATTLKLFPRSKTVATALAAIPTLEMSVQLLGRLRAASADRLAACELFARAALDLVIRHIPGTSDPFEAPHPWYLLIELQSALASEPLDGLLEKVLGDAIEDGQVLDAVIASNGAQRAALWKLRETISESMALEGAQIKHDVSVPITAIPAFVAEAGPWILARFPGARLITFGHIGDGNLHFNVSQPTTTDRSAFLARVPEIEHGVHDIAYRHGGSFSAEHGIGRHKLSELVRYTGAVELQTMRAVKLALDPNGIMNPGKVLVREN
jgi:FAD/FMN-containing dehydrogenase